MHCVKKKSSSISVVPLFSFCGIYFWNFSLVVHVEKDTRSGARERERFCVILIIIIAAASLIQLFFARIYVFEATKLYITYSYTEKHPIYLLFSLL